MIIKSETKITGVGGYVPKDILTNYDLQKLVDTSDEWIIRRTGIIKRHISSETENASNLAIKAVENLIEVYGADLSDVDMIVVSTTSPDHIVPNVASLIQGHFGIRKTGVMDINVACTGYVYALSVANAFITIGQNKKILVVATEAISKLIDYTDRNTCILFGDGASAFLLEKTDGKGAFIATNFETNGSGADSIYCSNHSKNIGESSVIKEHHIVQNGAEVYRYVMKNVVDGIKTLLETSQLSLSDIKWFVPHSANLRLIEGICKRLEYPIEKTLVSVTEFGNTSSASIPLAIWLALKESKIATGDKILLYGFGGGLTHGGIIIEW
ncbi:ketoacyl-ACP synthase III [Clostridium estertheticum]|uniref:ketoacyl-ACP synthase III n=1 Tax=Clostridium estertheticum TaxID=238834 RepID=UPI000AA62844|nr:ketoacyl-ACP synthase III [Clostridium estertheticum]MBU3073919.1 ketoacyl-ACP synthase III [Clostridium estertheticum]MBU3164014.1 ketoacyl-ACP synthase III [Clostridium estertheticum]MBZ9617276.1 ketoacyl-ACP synthase III [Clostridium estertheticum subsp. laramiense]WAG72965.1 ketoacyl-ACP synthase III [Clostridium estertheticum]